MDRVHKLDKKPWISQVKLHLKELLAKRECQLMESNIIGSSNTNDDDLERKLRAFVQKNQQQVKSFFLFNSTDERALIDEPECQLKCYKLQLEHAKKMVGNRAYKVSYLSKLRTKRKEFLMRHLTSINRPTTENVCPEQTPMSSFGALAALVVVQIWPQPNKKLKVKLEKEIIFRADQCLTELKDQFKCQKDYSIPMDLSDNPEQVERVFRGDLFKSGFFLIEDTFYNDMRDINNTDLSAPLIDWSSKMVTVVGDDGENSRVSRGIGPFKRSTMETTKFQDLEFRLGCPYLYLHQGDCEHLFTISDIRYVENDLKFRQTKLPYVTATAIGRKEDHLKCYMCKNRPPHWYTRNNSRLPVDPFFFCENCFYSFNYDQDMRKIGDFQAYLYTNAYSIPDTINRS